MNEQLVCLSADENGSFKLLFSFKNKKEYEHFPNELLAEQRYSLFTCEHLCFARGIMGNSARENKTE